MKEKSNHLKSIISSIAIVLVVPLFIFTSQTSSLAVQPSVAAGRYNTVCLKSAGTVAAVGGGGGWWLMVQMLAAGRISCRWPLVRHILWVSNPTARWWWQAIIAGAS